LETPQSKEAPAKEWTEDCLKITGFEL